MVVASSVCVCVCLVSVSHHFGFGMMDAAAMVEVAMNWTLVPDQHYCQVASTAQPRYRRFYYNTHDYIMFGSLLSQIHLSVISNVCVSYSGVETFNSIFCHFVP